MKAYLQQLLNRSGSLSAAALSRREFVKLSAAASVFACVPFFAGASTNVTARAGVQLFTVRDFMAVSVPATLKLIAAVGYRELEFAGYMGHSASDIQLILNDEGLSAPAAHVLLSSFDQGGQKVIDDALTIGHKYIVIPYLTEAQRGTDIATYQQLALRLNEIGEVCKKAGLQLAYHNHDFEFEMRQGMLPYDVLLDDTQSDLLVMEMDLYWMAKAQQDPLAYFKKYPGRFPLWHVKDMDKNGGIADVGTGTIDFANIFTHTQQAGLMHAFVEHDNTENKLKTLQQGYKALTGLMT